MRLIATLVLAFLTLALAAALPALAGPQCAAHDVVAKSLADQFGEVRRGIGLAADNTVMELCASAETGTWTVTVTQPSGQTCLFAAGSDFEMTADMLPNTDDPA